MVLIFCKPSSADSVNCLRIKQQLSHSIIKILALNIMSLKTKNRINHISKRSFAKTLKRDRGERGIMLYTVSWRTSRQSCQHFFVIDNVDYVKNK